jgi:capsular exopolysaccharide synthesis family protein
VEKELATPMLISIPRFQGGKDEALSGLPLLADPTSSASEAYRGLRTNVQFLAGQKGFKSLLITSPETGEGKTMTAANLGISLAQAGQKVILVSADLRRPTLDQRFGIATGKKGLTDWLLGGDVSPVESIVDPGIAHLRVIPSGETATNPAEILTSPRFVELLRFLEENADWVLIDAPPVLPVADATILASRVGGIIVVVNAKTTSRSAANHARTELERVGGRILGAVLNSVDESTRKYGSYYQPYKQDSNRTDGSLSRRRRRAKARATSE